MCGVLGLYCKTGINQKLFKILLQQSMIRGKHATGIAWNDKSKLKYEIFADSADKYNLPKIKTDMLIAHCRYSTSDLEYNQPIIDDNLAVVHNGVITQSDPKSWNKTYSMKFKTKNDSEIILRHWQRNIHPLSIEGSMSVIVLDLKEKPVMHFFRNEQRPLYWAEYDKHYIISSTKDILFRSGIKNINKTKSCYDYSIAEKIKEKKVRQCSGDLQ